MTVSIEEARDAVSAFYTKLADGDADGVAGLVTSLFADDAVLSRPESLPGGGKIGGAAKVVKFMRAAAGAAKGLRLRQLHVAAKGDEVHAFAIVDVTVGTPTSAIEWWVFGPSGVTSLTAYYWDTAGLLAG